MANWQFLLSRSSRGRPTRNVVLTDHHEEVIDRLVKSGRYQNASEVPREGLRLIELREAREAAKLEAGRFLDFASFDEFEDHLIRATEDALKAKPL